MAVRPLGSVVQPAPSPAPLDPVPSAFPELGVILNINFAISDFAVDGSPKKKTWILPLWFSVSTPLAK